MKERKVGRFDALFFPPVKNLRVYNLVSMSDERDTQALQDYYS